MVAPQKGNGFHPILSNPSKHIYQIGEESPQQFYNPSTQGEDDR
jgi:hypothetical protein